MVARAGEHELSATRVAGWFVVGESAPLRRDLAERVAHRWVDYTLFADRIAAGDSLLDSTTVLDAMWPEVYGRLVALYHEQLAAERVPTDSAAIDSAYAAGDYRLIWHILVRSQPTMPAAEKDAARARAEALRARLVAGDPWEAKRRMASALVLYWTTSQCLSIMQLLLQRRKRVKKETRGTAPDGST